jgi:hypothetical protein
MPHLTKPQQSERMLAWFFAQDVKTVDLHLRCPKRPGAVYARNEDWFWLTHNEGLTHDKALNLMSWCRHKNAKGSDIFIRAHRHNAQPIVFLDDLNISKARTVARKYRALAVETSNDNTQVWLSLARCLIEAERGTLQQHIVHQGFGDPGSVSGEHLGRLSGFKSQKRGGWVKLLGYSSSNRYDPPDHKPLPLPRRGFCAKTFKNGRSQSERDFSWVLGALRRGDGEQIITDKLEASARDRGKPSPEKYARRTVEKAETILT